MNLRQMEVFRAVVLAGGVGPAADLLHVSQPAVSKVLTQAGRQAGFALFERIKGRLVPTPEGQSLYQEIEALWRGVERVRDVSRNLAESRSGMLRIAASASLATCLVPRAVARLYERFPRLKIHTEVLVAPIMEGALLDRSVDIAVALEPRAHPTLARVRRYACQLSCVMHEDHPLAAKKSIGPNDLRGERLIAPNDDTPYGQVIARAHGAGRARLQRDLEVRSSTMACWYAQARAGIAIVDDAAVAGQVFAGLAVRRLRTTERLEVAVLRNLHRPMSMVEKAFSIAFDEAWRASMPHKAERAGGVTGS